MIVSTNFGGFWTRFDPRIIEFFGRTQARKCLWTLFSTAPVEPTLEFKVVGSTGDYKFGLLGFLGFLEVALVH